jgi:hypothetical protein
MAAAGVSDSRITSILSATMKAAKFAVVEISNVVERPWDARAIGRTSEIPRRLVRTKRDKLPCVPSLDPPYVGVKNDCTERDSYCPGPVREMVARSHDSGRQPPSDTTQRQDLRTPGYFPNVFSEWF